MKIRFTLLILMIIINGCASTKITGFTDPAYRTKSYKSTVILASNVGLEQASNLESVICDNFEQSGVICNPFQSIFPPTRQHSAEAVFEDLQRMGFDSLIVLTAGGDESSSQLFGYQSYGSATAYGNSAYGQTSSYALRSYSRESHMRVTLIDANTGETVWLGDARTAGRGLVNTTDSAFNSSVSRTIVSDLLETPHFNSK